MNATQVADIILGGPADEVSGQLADLLSILKDRLSDRPELAKSLPYRIIKRGAQDEARRKKLLQLYKVDPETVALLEENHTQWAQNPMLFWCRSFGPTFNVPATSAQAVLWTETAIIEMLHPTWGKSYTEEELGQEVRSMLAKGSHYRNIDQQLGPGSYLLLGKDFGESSWTKLIPKSGPRFEEMMTALRDAKVPDLAARYSIMNDRLLSYETSYIDHSAADLGQISPATLWPCADLAHAQTDGNINVMTANSVQGVWPWQV